MRLTPTQIDTINSTAQAVLGEGARVEQGVDVDPPACKS
jgi:hypothetical protein